MIKNWIIVALVFCKTILSAQDPFSSIPDVGGIGGQATSFVVVPISDSIIVLGHRYDTIIPGYNAIPWIGKFSYSGDLASVKQLVDIKNEVPFNVFNCPLAKKSDDIYYYYARIDTGGMYYNPYLIELNIRTGDILNSSIIGYKDDPDLPFLGTSIIYNGNIIYLLNYLTKSDSVLTVVTLVDTNFNLVKVINVKEVLNARNYGSYIALNSDSTISIIGFTKMETGPYKDNFHFYFNKIDFNGHSIDYNLAPTFIPLKLGLAHTNTIYEDIMGNWIISGLYDEDKSDSCFNCRQLIPYTFKANSNFSQLYWQTRFYDIASQNSPHYYLHSIAMVGDGYITSSDFIKYDGSPFPESGVLFKVSLDGDSLWMKHYIPVSWDSSRVAWVQFNDIKTTPYNTIVVAGSIGDNYDQKVKPWIMQLDADGCSIPGCNTVGIEDDYKVINDAYFNVISNPVFDNLLIQSLLTYTTRVKIQIATIDGKIIKSTEILANDGYQYILPIDDIPSGLYILVFSCKTFRECHKIIKQ
jgi:hypothetical protein